MTFLTKATRRILTPESSLGRLLSAALTPHAVDRYLELVDPMITWEEARARVVRVQRRTTRSVTLTLRTTRQFKGFRAGQFVQLGVVIDGVRHVRCFSPSCADDAREIIELTIARRPEGLVSNYLYKHAAVGDVYSITPATGSFTLPNPRPSRTLLIAGGSGITPVISMARSLVGNGYPGTLTILYYAPSAAENPYARELAELAELPSVTVHTEYTRAGGQYFGPEQLDAVAPWMSPPQAGGTPSLREDQAPAHADTQTFLCGPPSLHEAVGALYAERGISDRLHTEEFTLTTSGTTAEAGGVLRFATSDKGTVTAENDGRPILEQAEAAGLQPEFGCRMGICFACSAVKTSGCTRNLRTGDENDDPDQHIQLCITTPVGDVDINL
ncbi:ferredoxin reductase [Mycobacteroides sp. LB1]|uniref:ferredoxin reductase n=1 Tax=Mycobacteroides sp. LB1 TaxID=2750814 RepID=UPI0015DF815B|nr:ferredoxin reductase [Mycobacteroides sp. LB1]